MFGFWLFVLECYVGNAAVMIPLNVPGTIYSLLLVILLLHALQIEQQAVEGVAQERHHAEVQHAYKELLHMEDWSGASRDRFLGVRPNTAFEQRLKQASARRRCMVQTWLLRGCCGRFQHRIRRTDETLTCTRALLLKGRVRGSEGLCGVLGSLYAMRHLGSISCCVGNLFFRKKIGIDANIGLICRRQFPGYKSYTPFVYPPLDIISS